MIRNLLPKRLRLILGKLRGGALSRVLAKRAWRRTKFRKAANAHGLPGELIVSLTSYPPRFATLHLTLACLLDQTVKADRTIVWIAREHIDKLPAEVRRLEARGIEIRDCDDLRSYKKLIPALKAFPKAFIATADDDIYYPRDWLEMLVAGVEDGVIPCHRAHRIKRTATGAIAPYLEWDLDVQDSASRQPSADIVPTSGAGALYSPGSLATFAMDTAKFQRLCPDGDDLWFYWSARLVGTLHKKVASRLRLQVWPGSQKVSLWQSNEAGGNDRMIAALEQEFGPMSAMLS